MCSYAKSVTSAILTMTVSACIYVAILATVGCSTPQIVSPLKNDILEIKKSANTIIDETNKEKRIPVIQNEAKHIVTRADSSLMQTQNIENEVENARLAVEASDLKVKELEKEIVEMNENHIKKAKSVFVWLSVLGSISIIAGIAMVVFGVRSFGASLVAIGILTVALCYAFIVYSTIIALTALSMVLAILIYACYVLYKNRNAIKELVTSAEIMKKNNWDETTKNKVNEIQSQDTKLMVSEMKIKGDINDTSPPVQPATLQTPSA